MPQVSEPINGSTEKAFRQHIEEIYPPDVCQQIMDSARAPKRRAFFLNTLKATTPPVPASLLCEPGIFLALDAAALTTSEAAEDGRLYPINPSSSLVVAPLEVSAQHEVLDLAAAPGGKTLMLAAQMQNAGRIAAVEVVKQRFHRMRANLARCGVANVAFYLDDGRRTGRKVGERFDRVLLDAPCSSEARIRWNDPSTYRHWSARKVKEMARKQAGLIRSAFTALKPGGRMIYCTCSFSVEENELVVAELLKRHEEAELLPLPGDPPARTLPGLDQWRRRQLPSALAHCRRVLPDDLWDGFFMALIQKRV